MKKVPPIQTLLPHEPPMLLLHRVSEWTLTSLIAEVDCEKPSLFSTPQGYVPSLVGVEYLVQAMGALAGLKLISQGEKPQIGFLLGVRNYQPICNEFPGTGVLKISVNQVFLDETLNLGAFDGEISHGGTILCTGQIKAIMPSDPEGILQLDELN
ncbi:MAG: hypothetical protein OEZ23_00335 [Gammaproteobacteria bacterium]|nr:hypothetical protein [Gammaproteobacteria bacterium]